MRNLAKAALLFLAAAAPAAAAPPTTEELIDQLSSPQVQVRQAAEQALGKLGPDALPALRKALAAKPPLEVSRRLEQVLLAGLSKPKRVTLQVKDQTIREIVALLAKQSGYPIVLERGGLGEMWSHDLDLKDVTFWEALDAVCEKGELFATLDREKEQFNLKFSDEYHPHVYNHGPFRLVAQGFTSIDLSYDTSTFGVVSRKDARPSKDSNLSNDLSFKFQLTSEPHVPLVKAKLVHIEEATDNLKGSLATGKPTNWHERRQQLQGWQVFRDPFIGFRGLGYLPDLDADLRLENRRATKVSVLKGHVIVYLEKERRSTIVVPNLKEGVGKTFMLNGEELEIEEAGPIKGDRYHIVLRVLRQRPDDLRQVEGAPAELLQGLDDKGKALHATYGRDNLEADRMERLHVYLAPDKKDPAAGSPVKLLMVRREVVEYKVPFEFKDLPLPDPAPRR